MPQLCSAEPELIAAQAQYVRCGSLTWWDGSDRRSGRWNKLVDTKCDTKWFSFSGVLGLNHASQRVSECCFHLDSTILENDQQGGEWYITIFVHKCCSANCCSIPTPFSILHTSLSTRTVYGCLQSTVTEMPKELDEGTVIQTSCSQLGLMVDDGSAVCVGYPINWTIAT